MADMNDRFWIYERVPPLSVLSFNTAVTHLSALIQAYENSDVARKYLEFLQRRYSNQLFKKLMEDHTMQKEHLPFLLNKHLDELDLSSPLCYENRSLILERLKDIGDGIKFLRIESEKEWHEQDIIEILPLVRNCEDLQLRSSNADDAALEKIGEYCTQLKTLDLYGCTVTCDGIERFVKDKTGNLREHAFLHQLDLRFTYVNSYGIILALQHLPSLTVLRHHLLAEGIYKAFALDVKSNRLDRLPSFNLTNLEVNLYLHEQDFDSFESDIDELVLSNVLNVCTYVCPRIMSLAINGDIDSSLAAVLKKFECLQDVSISTGVSVDELYGVLTPFLEKSGGKLNCLRLLGCVISLEELTEFCPNLKTLCLEDVTLKNVNNESVKARPFRHLKEVILKNIDFGELLTPLFLRDLLSFSPVLEVLNVNDCRDFDDDIVDLLVKNNCILNLRHLEITYPVITASAALRLLLSIPRLVKFDIRGISLSDSEHQELLQASAARECSLQIGWARERGEYPDIGIDYDDDEEEEGDDDSYEDYGFLDNYEDDENDVYAGYDDDDFTAWDDFDQEFIDHDDMDY